MPIFDHDPFVAALRKRRGTIPADLYRDIIYAVEASQPGAAFTPAPAPVAAGSEPRWMTLARAQMGVKESPGTAHSSAILDWVARVGATWIKDDETPWCGAFVGAMLKMAEVPIVDKGLAVRAKAWATWGKETPLRLGAIVVFGRDGGGHVGFAAGMNNSNIYVLGGNQANAVNIMPIARSRLIATRWPVGLPLSDTLPPTMSGGTVSTNER